MSKLKNDDYDVFEWLFGVIGLNCKVWLFKSHFDRDFGDFSSKNQELHFEPNWVVRFSKFGASNSFQMSFKWWLESEFDVWLSGLSFGMLNGWIIEVLNT